MEPWTLTKLIIEKYLTTEQYISLRQISHIYRVEVKRFSPPAGGLNVALTWTLGSCNSNSRVGGIFPFSIAPY